MKNNKGISMITLIITIIVMIILLGLAYRIGTRYISESREEERNALLSLMSSAVEKRQKDNYVGMEDAKAYYAGYHISSEDFELLYDLFHSNESIYGPGLWYMIDANNAEDLGIVDANNYLVKDLDTVDIDKGKYVAVADYYTGTVYLIDYHAIEEIEELDLNKIVQGSEGTHNPDHEPIWTVATCTEPSVCKLCGYVNTEALGHEFNLEYATCTEDKECIRCGFIEEKATGHNYDLTKVEFNARGHYNPCKNIDQNTGETCGAAGNFGEHNLKYIPREGTEWTHDIYCDYEQENGAKCEYEAVGECNVKIKPKDLIEHIRYCPDCGKEVVEAHDDIRYRYVDKNHHVIYCATCNTDLGLEEHIDVEAPLGYCDKCNGPMDTSKAPTLSVTMEKVGTNLTEEQKYLAKKGDTITITIKTDMPLSSIPTLKIQGKVIKASDIETVNTNTYVATIDTANYPFTDGVLNLEVTNIKSLWGVTSSNITETADGKYIMYDGTIPEYFYIP